MQVVNGWTFPDDVDVPEDCWSKAKAGGDEFHIFGWQGYVSVAHQCSLEGTDCEIVADGVDADGIPWLAAKATVKINGDSYSAIGSIDAPANSLEDMGSTAQTRALKRAIRLALDIRRHGEPPDEPRTSGSTSSSGSNIPSGIDNPPSEW